MTKFCEYGNELPGSIKCDNFLDWLRNYKFLKKDLLHGISLLYLYLCITNLPTRH